MIEEEFALQELAERAGVSARTIRFYIQKGALPSPGMRGPGVRYDQGYLDRLQLIRRMREQNVPLDEIGARLRQLSDPEVAGLLRAARERPQTSALDYVRGVLSGGEANMSRPAGSALTFAPVPAQPRSQWERIEVSQGIELHVRSPLSREETRVVQQLLDLARNLLTKE
jgi:Ca-activated chloride channel family protein